MPEHEEPDAATRYDRPRVEPENADVEQTIEGRLIGGSGRGPLDGVTVWFAYRTVHGDMRTIETTSDASGAFSFEIPSDRLQTAHIGAATAGARPVDLDPVGETLEPGTLVLIVDDFVPSHLRFGCC